MGILAVVLLAIGGFTLIGGPGGSSAAGFAGGCIRVGLVLGAIWLAMPQIQAMLARSPRWLLGWFTGQKGAPPSAGLPRGEPPAKPVVQAPRPRRRSNSR